MPSVYDVAAAILERTGSISTMKLQKLVYYAKAWHAVWDEEELFPEAIEAWANGPVCRPLYAAHRGMFTVGPDWISSLGKSTELNESQLGSIAIVTDFYGSRTANELSQLTHREAPWRDARASASLKPGDRGSVEITTGSMADYYSGLSDPDDD